MEKQSQNSRGELITWYLARLRNNARQSSLERKLTPMTLVQTDKTLIQEIVASSHSGIEQKSRDLLLELQNQNRGIRISLNILMALVVAGTLAILLLAIL